MSLSLPGRAPAFIAGAPPLYRGIIDMIQSFLNIFTVFFNNYSNPIILLCCGIFAAEACVYLVKRMTFR